MPKHNGCHDCKTLTPEILISVPILGQLASKAVCEACCPAPYTPHPQKD